MCALAPLQWVPTHEALVEAEGLVLQQRKTLQKWQTQAVPEVQALPKERLVLQQRKTLTLVALSL